MEPPSRYANVAPPPPPPPPPRERKRKESVCASCNCPNCHDIESCSGSVVNGGYLRTVADQPPVPCRVRRFTDDFSPEISFSEVVKECDKPKPNTRRMKELDIPLPLPSAQSNDSVFDIQPSSNHPAAQRFLEPFIPPNLSIHDRFVQRHPSPQPASDSQTIPKTLHRKPSDELPNPNIVNQPLIHERLVDLPNLNQKEKDNTLLPQFDLTLPRRKSEQTKKGRRRPAKVPVWMKCVTSVAFMLFVGLTYFVFNGFKEIFFVHHRHLPPIQQKWNYSEPDESKLDTTVCFSCELVDEFSRLWSPHSAEHKIYGFKSSENGRHCCMDQLGHTKWLINMMKTREILGKQEMSDPDESGDVCSAKSTHVPVYNKCSKDKASLKLDNRNMTPMCKGAGINVTNDALVATEEGLYIVYMTLTVTLTPNKECGKRIQKKVLSAHLHCNKSAKKRCIEMETFNMTHTNTDAAYYQHAFNLYTMKNFTRGEHFFPSLSHPSYLYSVTHGNYIGVVQL